MATSSGQQLEPNKASSASQKIDNPEISVATTPQEAIGQNVSYSNRPTLKVTLLSDEWNSCAGGLSTINRELAIHFSKHPKVEVSLLVPEGACKDEEKRAAQNCGITVVDAKQRPAYDPLDWLSFPPPDLSLDIVVGHGVKLGRQGQVIRDSSRFHNCKWVQVVHTAPEDLSKYKSYADPISKGERKHQDEVDLCKLADLVVPVGPRLEEFYSSYLRCCKKDQDVFSITPGLFIREFGDLEQASNENADFKVLIFGRGDDEDFELKGYNIAAEAFTDQRLKQKPYHLIFVGAPEGKQGEVRQKLLQCGIAEEQLTVRKFIQSRDRMKDLLCEADLAIMPSRSEGFGLVALEALSAGLPILVGRKSGFAKALENVLFGKSCIVDSDDPTKWAKAIEAIRVRHGMRLEEIKALRASYEMKYSWKKQCEALVERMWKMVHEPVVGLQDVVEEQTFAGSGVLEAVKKPCSVQQYRNIEEKEVSGTNEDAITLSKNSRKRSRSIAESNFDSGPINSRLKTASVEYSAEQQLPSEKGPQPKKRAFGTNEEGTVNTVIRMLFATQNLSDEQQEIVDEMLTRQIQVYMKHHKLSTPDRLGAFIEYVINAHNLALQSVGMGSLVIEVQCPTLESLESLWNDYRSGHLNKVAERYLVTNEIKRKLNLETVKLKTTIEEENYLICKKALMEQTITCPSNENVSVPKVECFVENLSTVHTPGTIVCPPLEEPDFIPDEKTEMEDFEISEEASASSLSDKLPSLEIAPTILEFPSIPASSSQDQEIDKDIAVEIEPDSGSVNGGTPFSLNNLQVDSSVSYVLVSFGAKQVRAIREYGENSWLGKSPRTGEPGPVIVTVTAAETGANLGDTTFTYVPENLKKKTNTQSVKNKRELEMLNYLLHDMARSIKKLKTDDCGEGDGILDFQQQASSSQDEEIDKDIAVEIEPDSGSVN